MEVYFYILRRGTPVLCTEHFTENGDLISSVM